MNRLRLASVVTLTAAVCACATAELPAAPPAGPVPARLAILGPACFEQIAGFVATQTGHRVTLGPPSTFANSDRLVLEPPGFRAPDGRVVGKPPNDAVELFRFVLAADECRVIHERTAAAAALPGCGCVRAGPP